MDAKSKRASDRERSRLAIADRLFREGLYDEAAKLRFCGETFELLCTCCGSSKDIPKSCNRRWCPDCAFIRGVELVGKYLAIVEAMAWPMMLTLTVPHEAGNCPEEQLNQLRAGLKKLRRLKWFKQAVRGGLGAIEISGGANGWHLHAHLLLECRWLAVVTPEPRRGMSRMAVQNCFRSAQREVASQWGLCIGEDSGHVWIKRANRKSIYEALKYAVKPGTLERISLPLGPLIRGMKHRRFVSGWGTVRKEAARLAREERDKDPGLRCDCGESDWMLGRTYDAMMADMRDTAAARGYRQHCDQLREERRRSATKKPGKSRR